MVNGLKACYILVAMRHHHSKTIIECFSGCVVRFYIQRGPPPENTLTHAETNLRSIIPCVRNGVKLRSVWHRNDFLRIRKFVYNYISLDLPNVSANGAPYEVWLPSQE